MVELKTKTRNALEYINSLKIALEKLIHPQFEKLITKVREQCGANNHYQSDLVRLSLLLLAAASFAHMPLGLSDRNSSFPILDS